MADKTILFTIDASEIIAKLHYAGLQPVKGDVKSNDYNGFIVNTGIVDDDPNGSPENIGNARFDLKNSTNRYQVGFVRDFSYKMLFSLENIVTDVSKLRSEMLSKGQKKLLDQSNEDDVKLQQKFNTAVETTIDAFTRAQQTYEGVKVNMPKKEDFNTVEGLEKIRAEAVRIQNDFASADFNKNLKDAKAKALEILQTYMDVFAGKDNMKAMDENSIQAIQVSDEAKTANAKGLVKDFEIQAISSKELSALNAKFKTDALENYSLLDKNGNIATDRRMGEYECNVRMCFYVNYTMAIESK